MMQSADTSSVTAYTVATGTAIWGAYSVDMILIVTGILANLIAIVVNGYYKRKEDKRAQERHELHMSNNGSSNDSSIHPQ